MKLTSGFDRKNSGFYRWVLCGFALASMLMLVAALFGKSTETSPGRLHSLIWPALACLVAIWGYISTRNSELSFRYVGIAGVAFSIAMYGFGMPHKLTLLVGMLSLIGAVASAALGENANNQVEDDDPGPRI